MPRQALAGGYQQAAAGYGEYMLSGGGGVFDGVRPEHAEMALNTADGMQTPVQAAAGYGDIPQKSIWIPGQQIDPTAGVSGLGGGDGGIFGGSVLD